MALTGNTAPPPGTDPLVAAAEAARVHAYAPYSHYRVGAALACRDGRVFVGVNVENASYGLTVCAERHAVAAAAVAGARPGDICRVAVVAHGPAATVTPCGACRQVLLAWAAPEAEVACCGLPSRTLLCYPLATLLPAAFALDAGRPQNGEALPGT